MEERIIIAGFGGQGVLLLGKLLAHLGLLEDKNVSWIPSYGPEMRGGTANCTVVISDGIIGSPIVPDPDTVIALNRPSLEKFENFVIKDGLLLYNKSLIEITPKRTDIKSVAIPASDIANELGNVKLTNMVMAGAYLEIKKLFNFDRLEEALKDVVSARWHKLIPLNLKAIERGREEAKKLI